jgi:hypothetical protein
VREAGPGYGPEYAPGPVPARAPGADPVPASVPAAASAPVSGVVIPPPPAAPPLSVPGQVPLPGHLPVPLPDRVPGTVAVPRPVREQPAAHDPHAAILEAAGAGRHSEAASMAAAWEQEALRAGGPRSPGAVHWLEVRADLARLAGDPARACELWMSVADIRLGNGEPADHADVEAAVDRAHHQWQQVADRHRAGALAPVLIALRRRVPGRRPGALEAVRHRAEFLQTGTQAG